MKLAAIDIGTNSTKATIAETADGRSLIVLSELTEITRLGKGVDSSGRLNPDAISRTLAAVRRFVDSAHDAHVERIAIAGTSALRDAANGADFLAMVKQETGLDLEIISGDREAELAYGAVRSDTSLSLNPRAPLVVFDIGGGSTELIVGGAHGLDRHVSLNIGAVRLTERFLHTDPPTPEEVADISEGVIDALAEFRTPDGPVQVAGIGGTAVNVAAVVHPQLHGAVHGDVVSRNDVAEALATFMLAPLAERRQIPGLEPDRADVIIAGTLILGILLARCAATQFLVSTHGLRYGLLAEMAEQSV